MVDAGSEYGELQEALFEAANAVYLVSQVSLVDLRNANRVIRRYFAESEPGHLEIVLNRYLTRGLEIDEAAITKALTQQASWKIPNDYPSVRKAQNAGVAIASEESPISRILADMARKAAGQAAPQTKRKKFGLFG
ncbi:MAG: hypothetical protein ACJ74Y_13225 [Bryobacteraceae bacterium]